MPYTQEEKEFVNAEILRIAKKLNLTIEIVEIKEDRR